MKKTLLVPLASALAVGILTAASPTVGAPVTDTSFNELLGSMAGRDTGSQWFDYYVASLNQEIAHRSGEEPFGAAGPSGPASGFDAYLGTFAPPDTGSMWFNAYVDYVNQQLREQQQ